MANTSSDDVRNAVNTALEQVKTSLLAALGAGQLASQAVTDAVGKAKDRVNEGSETARRNIEELPSDVESLRDKLEPAELRKLLDEYTDAALKLYHKLAESGEQTWEKFLAQPQVKKNVEQLEEVLQSAQGRVDGISHDVRDRVDDVVSKVTGRTREVGEEAANKVEDAAVKVEQVTSDVADKVEETAPSAAKNSNSKAAPRTATTRRTTSAAAKKPANNNAPKNTK
ncbi:hypothetical protein [Prauserella cavernicola]|uniref:Heparin binding hemagglutinin HbhA n=1 Tax=Prauserella cavernicola TaxID=2800127 RepID=A0A934QRW8_9PSEU|nr:hypothetical protein [Prauserella cavernicola]MBK1784244.1 hypothetical protein [Prauserella cavernicola]